MMTVMVAALLALGTTFAAGTIVSTCRRYRGAPGILRQMLAQCRDEQVVRIAIYEWSVSETARILRPDFKRPQADRYAARELRAAA